jgi:hypothetical protein
MKTQYLFILILLIPLLFTGCGGSSSDSDDVPDPENGSSWDQMKWDQGKWV